MKRKVARRRSGDPVKRLEGMSPKLGMVVLGIGAVALWVPPLPKLFIAIILIVAGVALIFMGEK